ncbi:citrate lyase subunit beta [Brevibacillus laterosporus]|uniref:Citrate lyase subunit beta n=1 Tax=Brevibacillus laterosporus TaxID=1465 RepID=A0A518V6U0_BRELA|nr:citrate lyase subunit beta [Brevibacillus laterosporus]
MRYFHYLTAEEQQSIFYQSPGSFDRFSDKYLLSHSLGALLYMPGTRKQIVDDIIVKKHRGLISMVLCLEDAIGDNEVLDAENSLIAQVHQIALLIKNGRLQEEDVPLIFIRVREPEQINRLVNQLGEHSLYVTGFVFPKFSSSNGERYFETLIECNKQINRKLYGMPILESSEIIYKETRVSALVEVRNILDKYRDVVLNVRIGATDFSSLFGLRRNPGITIYDLSVIRDCIADIVNMFSRKDSDYVVSGPVWEYFNSTNLPPKTAPLSPFNRNTVVDYEEGLIREVMLDKENGLLGKTIIHPSHIRAVQSLYVVSHEEYMDALAIVQKNDGEQGVMKSEYANKMNEIKPHLNWSNKILMRANIYGVYHAQNNFTNLLAERI